MFTAVPSNQLQVTRHRPQARDVMLVLNFELRKLKRIYLKANNVTILTKS